MEIKEYMIKQNELKRPVLVIKRKEGECVHEISEAINCDQTVVDVLDKMFDVSHLAEEYVWMFCMTSDFKLSGIFEISHGSINGSYFCIREIIQKALLAGAVSIIVAHCHPSGNPAPSDLDITVTKQLYDACVLMNIPLNDHIIVGCDDYKNYYSFRKEGIIKNWQNNR